MVDVEEGSTAAVHTTLRELSEKGLDVDIEGAVNLAARLRSVDSKGEF